MIKLSSPVTEMGDRAAKRLAAGCVNLRGQVVRPLSDDGCLPSSLRFRLDLSYQILDVNRLLEQIHDESFNEMLRQITSLAGLLQSLKQLKHRMIPFSIATSDAKQTKSLLRRIVGFSACTVIAACDVASKPLPAIHPATRYRPLWVRARREEEDHNDDGRATSRRSLG